MPSRFLRVPLAIAAIAGLVPQAATQEPAPVRREAQRPLKVFILLGQSNMVGFGRVGTEDLQGSLAALCRKDGRYPELLGEDGAWVARDDVWCVKTTVGQKQGWLQPGFGARGDFFGPELGFGEVVGDALDEPVLLIKASQGNRSLGWDILPPGSERFEFGGRVYAGYKDTPDSRVEGEEKKPVDWYAGKQYDDFVRDIHEVLDDLPRFFPDYAGQGYEVAGFAWWQGHKDQNPAHASRYEQNLVRLIKCLREEFEAPEAPFVLATIAFEAENLKGPGLTVAEAQLAVSGERGKYPEFAENARCVEARPFWREQAVSPSGQGYHDNPIAAEAATLPGCSVGATAPTRRPRPLCLPGPSALRIVASRDDSPVSGHNAETYMEVGRALGGAMTALLRASEVGAKRR